MSEAADASSNRLAEETSPYLQQHASNPVDWYPWGEEALTKAREEDKPIFLSIGYSACHWCHVMEHESFENADIAAVMNENFVCIKVDREERPDLDQIYMNAVVAMTGHGGWPMSVFLMPDRRPFFGGTYWPPTSRMNMPGFRDILTHIHRAWVDRRGDVENGAAELTNAVATMSVPDDKPQQLGIGALQNAMQKLVRSADREHGGFGRAPKFPHAMDLRVLLRCYKRFGNDEALEVVNLTLDKMARGGIYDHLGGGFHRYATDAKWLVPHFEKMLYDNALLVPTYLEAYQATGNEQYARVVWETCDYVLREMTSSEGGFFSTQDADSEGEEGKFFVWSKQEIDFYLADHEEDSGVFNWAYGVTEKGNWEGKSILERQPYTAEEDTPFGLDAAGLERVLEELRSQLFNARESRIHPGRDEKVLTGWNGLMIAAMAQAGAVLNDERYTQAAASAAKFVLKNLVKEDRLLHAYKDGRSRFNAYLDDYACLIDGLVELYQANFDERWITEAVQLAEQMIARYADEEAGGFFYTAVDHEELIVRQKDAQDNATPAGNTMAATALLKLARLTTRTDFEDRAIGTLDAISGVVASSPLAAGQGLIALDFLLGPTQEIVIVDPNQSEEGNEMVAEVRKGFRPNQVLVRTTGDTEGPLKTLIRGKASPDGKTKAFVCEKGVCHEPVGDVASLKAQLS
ncbi:thioredoxin domain-containing protein [Stratiformator vulcanicus]|uniref:Glycosyl Hydrolase Family 88 n=1 Tax=Stratiformator vulcanicus TaxID=2527980 RepID=A0A517R503_9PLAN|nr:thioredoxin domain-containing protein [Stratiformator vulcanicus]QDT38968.1 Glycosyl Hydrolase Family 88 [Stratiformator vulcanicus]